MKNVVRTVLLAASLVAGPALAAAPAPADQASSVSASPEQAIITKLNAYVELLNRTLRAQESLARYQSWVNMKTGPTGRERIIYGLYSLYDVRDEIAHAEAAMTQSPAMPELDAEMKSYIAAYQALAPTITEADAYYERQDYRTDKMAQGKALHAKLVVAGPTFLTERGKVDALFKIEKEKSDAAELAAIEAREGRKARWQVTNVMIEARKVVDLLPTGEKPVDRHARLRRGAGALRRCRQGHGRLQRREPGLLLHLRKPAALASRQAAGTRRHARPGEGRRAAGWRQRPHLDPERLQHDGVELAVGDNVLALRGRARRAP